MKVYYDPSKGVLLIYKSALSFAYSVFQIRGNRDTLGIIKHISP